MKTFVHNIVQLILKNKEFSQTKTICKRIIYQRLFFRQLSVFKIIFIRSNN